MVLAGRGDAPSSGAGELNDIVVRVDRLFAVGDYAAAVEMIERNLLEVWYGARPERLAVMLQAFIDASLELPPLVRALQVMMQPGAGASGAFSTAEPEGASVEAGMMVQIARLLDLRLQGRVREAFELSMQVRPSAEVLHPLFDTAGGWRLFAAVQVGLTAMLAGEFRFALARFTEARLHVPVPALSFLTRDAYVKAALIHGCFGDAAASRAALLAADEVPRTESWVEEVIDASAEVARALVLPESHEAAMARLDAIPLRHIGESWPFYAFAIQIVFERADRRAEAVGRLEMLDSARLPRVDGQGFSGSVIPSSLAGSAVVAGNAARARELLDRADPSVLTTQTVEAMYAIATGSPEQGVRIARRMHAGTRDLRQLELYRLALLAAGLHLLGDRVGCVTALGSAVAIPGGLSAEETGYFLPELRRLAASAVPGWPGDPASYQPHSDTAVLERRLMTPREFEVLALMAQELNRAELARRMGVSVNTVKAHQQAIYRKLGVSGRSAAVTEAERRGLL